MTLLDRQFTVRVREPQHADQSSLLAQLRDGNYAKPFIVEDGELRRLQFGLDYVQSEMRIDEPDLLTALYTRNMMAFLLFVPRLEHLIIVGLGGGSLTKFCHRHLLDTRVTTLEVDEDVIACGELFDIPAADPRTHIVQADAAAYFARTTETADVVLLDGCDKDGIAPGFLDPRFYRHVRERLRPGGMLVMNLVGPVGCADAHLRLVTETFGRHHVIVQNLDFDDQRLMFAFKDLALPPDWPAIGRLAGSLEQKHGLEFCTFARQLEARFKSLASVSSGSHAGS